MSSFARRKRVTDPLDEKVKARIVGRQRCQPVYISSGSDHSAEAYDGHVSTSLSDLVQGFLGRDTAGAHSPAGNDSDFDRASPMYDSRNVIEDLMTPILRCNVDSYGNLLAAHVSKAMELFSSVKLNKPIFRRNVMSFLRNFGYNAAVCKTKWETSGGLGAGNYEFIDVIKPDYASNFAVVRYFIDIDFVGEFQIARPTDHYEQIVQSLPKVFVGKSEELKQILRIMSNAVRRSLKTRDLHIPPWRKNRYMQNKWLGPNRRTTNLCPVNSFSLKRPEKPALAVKCRLVGFNTAGDGLSLFPATTHTHHNVI